MLYSYIYDEPVQYGNTAVVHVAMYTYARFGRYLLMAYGEALRSFRHPQPHSAFNAFPEISYTVGEGNPGGLCNSLHVFQCTSCQLRLIHGSPELGRAVVSTCLVLVFIGDSA